MALANHDELAANFDNNVETALANEEVIASSAQSLLTTLKDQDLEPLANAYEILDAIRELISESSALANTLKESPRPNYQIYFEHARESALTALKKILQYFRTQPVNTTIKLHGQLEILVCLLTENKLEFGYSSEATRSFCQIIIKAITSQIEKNGSIPLTTNSDLLMAEGGNVIHSLNN